MKHMGLLFVIATAVSIVVSGGPKTVSAQDKLEIDIEVVGFDIKAGSSEEKQLREIAASGGGNYLPAEDGHKLMAAISATVAKVLADQPPPPPAAKPQSDGWVFVSPGDFGLDSEARAPSPGGVAAPQPAPGQGATQSGGGSRSGSGGYSSGGGGSGTTGSQDGGWGASGGGSSNIWQSQGQDSEAPKGW
jgi:hypothetical protein